MDTSNYTGQLNQLFEQPTLYHKHLRTKVRILAKSIQHRKGLRVEPPRETKEQKLAYKQWKAIKNNERDALAIALLPWLIAIGFDSLVKLVNDVLLEEGC